MEYASLILSIYSTDTCSIGAYSSAMQCFQQVYYRYSRLFWRALKLAKMLLANFNLVNTCAPHTSSRVWRN